MGGKCFLIKKIIKILIKIIKKTAKNSKKASTLEGARDPDIELN